MEDILEFIQKLVVVEAEPSPTSGGTEPVPERKRRPETRADHQSLHSRRPVRAERRRSTPHVPVDPAKLEVFLAAQEREVERGAQIAYASAFSAMAPCLPVVQENGRITVGDEVVSTYALWEDINDAIRPVLFAHGFALSFRTGQDADAVIVTALLTHQSGHSCETTLRLPPDPGPSRNSVQAIGSSVSYGKRYTACALLNITTRGEDDDGRAAGGVITAEQVHELEEGIAAAKTSRKRVLRYLKVESLELLPAARFADAKAALKAKAQNLGGAQ